MAPFTWRRTIRWREEGAADHRDLTATAEVGKTYLGKVVRMVDFGAFVEIFPGTDGLLHISEIAENRSRKFATS
jgi:polyribonucleotide nucleotidyltransferase